MKQEDAKIVGMMLVRNESWIVKASMLIALEWVDELVILDDESTDATPDQVVDVCRVVGSDRVHYQRSERKDSDRWDEMDLRQRLYEHAQTRSPTHYAIIDADEIPVAPVVPHLRRLVSECLPGTGCHVPMHSPYRGVQRRRVDGDFEPSMGIFLGFRETPGSRWGAAPDGYQHHQRCPSNVYGHQPAYGPEEGGVMHMQFASIRRLQIKAAYYKMMETIMYPGRAIPEELNAKYDWTLNTDKESLVDIPHAWWDGHRENGHMTHIDLQADPWQLQGIHELIEKYGEGPFFGLNMHGIV